ncbi:MAG: flagellar biosynthetic protein FliO [Clostridia bacterium]|nr:flagellar biosynthetic protein FliO [Clostridia bacterium]
MEGSAAGSLVLGLVLIVAVLVAAWWVTRLVAGRAARIGLGAMGAAGSFRVLAQLSLGREQRLLLVRAGERYFLLGVTGSAVTPIAEYTAEEVSAWQSAEQEGPAFGASMLDALRKKSPDRPGEDGSQ